MKQAGKKNYQNRRGAALIISMIFVLIFSALAVSMATMTGANLQLADNQHKVNYAFANAESGLEVTGYWLRDILIASSTAPSDFVTTIAYLVQDDLIANDISNFTIDDNGFIPAVALDSATGQEFSGQIQMHPSNPDTIEVTITGRCNETTRKVKVNYNIIPYEHPIFDYGLATKGPVHFPRNPTIRGLNSADEADIYIESHSDDLALLISGNTNFDGDIYIGNANANVDLQGDVLIAGEHGETAIENHVTIGADPVDFPTPDIEHFLPYATGDTIDSSTDTTNSMTLTNATIAAGTNPCFEGNVRIEGVLFVQSPNKIVFNSNVDIRGIIIADGDVDNPEPGTNSMTFLGNFESGPLPDSSEFDVLRSETGSCLLAPGFTVSLEGNFATLNGVMAVSGFHLTGNANAMIEGSIINYSDSPTIIDGNVTFNFDRSNSNKIPAGFDTHMMLEYNPMSYNSTP